MVSPRDARGMAAKVILALIVVLPAPLSLARQRDSNHETGGDLTLTHGVGFVAAGASHLPMNELA
jgi:hypothetical protein